MEQWDLNPRGRSPPARGTYWDVTREGWLPVLYAAGARPLTLKGTISTVSSTNDLVELNFAQPGNASLPEIELRVDGTLAATARQRENNNRVKPGPLPGQPAKVRPAVGQARAHPTSQRQYGNNCLAVPSANDALGPAEI